MNRPPDLSPEDRQALKTFLQQPGLARKIADDMAHILQQEYKLVDGAWWLFSLGKPQRALSPEEVADARLREEL